MAITQPTTLDDEMDMRALLSDTMTKLGVKATPPTVSAPTTPKEHPQPKPPLSRQEQLIGAGIGLVLLVIASVLWGRWQATAPTTAPTPRQTAAPTSVPTVAPTAAPAALIGYFDYRNPASVAPITANQITRVVAQAGDGWRLVEVGNARVWIPAALVPTGIPVADPLPDLAPPTPRPAPAVQPVSAPPVASPAPCTQDVAPYVVHRQVQAGTLPIGEVTGWSCTSAAEAEASASAQEQQVHANYQATTTTKTSEAGR